MNTDDSKNIEKNNIENKDNHNNENYEKYEKNIRDKNSKKYRRRFKFIMKSLFTLVMSLVGLWEFIQLYLSYDLPQVIVVIPIFSCAAFVILKKYLLILLLLLHFLSHFDLLHNSDRIHILNCN